MPLGSDGSTKRHSILLNYLEHDGLALQQWVSPQSQRASSVSPIPFDRSLLRAWTLHCWRYWPVGVTWSSWAVEMRPASYYVRDHLLHLIGSWFQIVSSSLLRIQVRNKQLMPENQMTPEQETPNLSCIGSLFMNCLTRCCRRSQATTIRSLYDKKYGG